MSGLSTAKPSRRFWIVSSLALAWNLIGVMSYLVSVTAGPEALAVALGVYLVWFSRSARNRGWLR